MDEAEITLPASTEAVVVPPAAALAASPVRIDRWLWAARFFKTRSQAAKACTAGHVKVNDATVKAAKLVRPGDTVDVVTPGGPKLVDILALSEKRGGAPEARLLYHDRTPPPPPDEERFFARRERGAGRPVKRERRILAQLRGR
jgi:ribosome-associated heat shock protein Hsp15